MKANRDRVPAFVEEVLRYRPVLQSVGRVATCDVELGGVAVPRGAALRMLLGSANVDESTFEDAEVFNIGRKNRTPHPLARAEMRIAFNHVLDLARSLRLDPTHTPVPHVGGSTNEYGWDELYLILEREGS